MLEMTIVIPTYRRPKLLKRAIQSCIRQTYDQVQILVCDNASGDETGQVVAEMAKEFPIEYFCHEKNLGMIGNYKFGLSKVQTEFFSFLSDDDVLLPSFCEEAMQGFGRFPEAAFSATSTVIFSETRGVVRIPLSLWPREGVYLPPEGALEMIGKYPVPTTVMFRTEAIKSIHIDAENPLAWDCDFLIQIAARYPIVISKKMGGVFFTHPESFSGQAPYEDIKTSILKMIARSQKLHCDAKAQKKIASLLKNDIDKITLIKVVDSFLKGKIKEVCELGKGSSHFKLRLLYVFSRIAAVLPPTKWLLIHLIKFIKIVKNKIKQNQKKTPNLNIPSLEEYPDPNIP